MIVRTILNNLRASGIFPLMCLAFLSTSRAAIPPAEQMLPPDTLLVVSAPDFIKLRTVLEKIPLVQCWNDPAMKPFRDKFMVHWKEEFIAPLERHLGVKVDDFAEMPRGQFTLALTKEDWNAQDGNPPGSLLLVDTRER